MKQQDQLPRATLLVTDLDNTLYDWFAMWYPAFSVMVETICSTSRIPREVLLSEIRQIHQKRGTSEYSYLLNELPSLKKFHPSEDIAVVYKQAIDRYRYARQKNMQLYPGVRDSLLRIKQLGVPIVAYTESLAYYSSWRIRELGLDGIIDYLYSPPDHDFPEGITPEMLRSQPPEAYVLKKTEHRHIPRGVLKPNVEVLQGILNDMSVRAATTIYVGDSLMKDVAMAQGLRALDVLAKYGTVRDEVKYGLLQQVSHWTERDVRCESETYARSHVAASYVLHERFDEIFDLFTFGDQR